MAVGPNHELLICDYKYQCVFVLDSELNLLNTLGVIGGDQLTHPNGVAIDKDRTIALSDYRFYQVKKFLLNDGKCISSIGALGPEDSNFDYTLVDLLLAVMGSFKSWIRATQGFKFLASTIKLLGWVHLNLTGPIIFQWITQTMWYVTN